ncbi:MAG: hypothetical protein Kow00109_14300 [Acidobacteriota bacterium]
MRRRVGSISLTLTLTFLLAGPVGMSRPLQTTGAETQEEMRDYYRRWLEEDVVYIITPEERDVFLKLQTDEERDRFIEEFWRRRDPDPKTAVNEFKEEHYRRIQYANEHFTAGIPGWKTDRGMVYIKFGPPDDIEDYPAGSTYVRLNHEGGGTTLVNPFQVWRYNYIEGVGDNVEIEFVDPHGGNLYRFARDLQEKDMLLFHPLGYTFAEELAGGDKTERIVTRQLGDVDEGSDNLSGYTLRSKDMPLERLQLHKELEAPPPIKFDDLKKIVTTRVQYSTIPLAVSSACFRLDDKRSQAVVSVVVKDSELTFQPAGEVMRAQVDLYGQVTTIGNLLVYEFEDTLTRDKPRGEISTGSSVLSKALPLQPGRYKLSLVVRDVNSGRIGTMDAPLVVPSWKGNLELSPLALASRITRLASESEPAPVVLAGRYKPVLHPERQFRSGNDVFYYLEIYGFAVDQASSQPSLDVRITLKAESQPERSYDDLVKGSPVSADLLADRVVLIGKLPAGGLEAGRYLLGVRVRDQIQGSEAETSTTFELVP